MTTAKWPLATSFHYDLMKMVKSCREPNPFQSNEPASQFECVRAVKCAIEGTSEQEGTTNAQVMILKWLGKEHELGGTGDDGGGC